MIILDSIIYSLQGAGGISVYFDNIKSGLISEGVSFCDLLSPCTEGASRLRAFERYRNCVVNSNSGGRLFHSSYYRLPSDKSLKILTTVHDFTYEKFVNGPAKWIHSWQKYRAIRCSDIVICVSHNTAHDLMQYCPIEPERIRVIHNGVSDKYHPLSGYLTITNAVLFVGARGGYKNFNLAMRAVAKTENLELHIVGGGKLDCKEIGELEKWLPGRYRWLGRLSDEALNQAYNNAYALLYPSSYEGFGIPIIEAMRAGCPVVAVQASSIPEVAGDAAILVDSPDENLFASALVSVAHKRAKLRLAGFEQAAKFSWDRCFAETLAVYKELL